MISKSMPTFAVLATIALIFAGTAAHGQGKELFPSARGAHWDYKGSVGTNSMEMSATVTSTKLEGATTVLTVQWTQNGKPIQDETYNLSAAGVTRSRAGLNGTIISNPPVPIMKFPMAVGKAWKWKGEVDVQGTKAQGQADIKVTSVETIKTVAGTFKAFRVEMDLSTSAQGTNIKAINKYWFAEKVGLVKQEAILSAPNNQKIIIGAALTKYSAH